MTRNQHRNPDGDIFGGGSCFLFYTNSMNRGFEAHSTENYIQYAEVVFSWIVTFQAMLPIYVSGFCLSNEAEKFKSFLNNDLPIVLGFDGQQQPPREDIEGGLSDDQHSASGVGAETGSVRDEEDAGAGDGIDDAGDSGEGDGAVGGGEGGEAGAANNSVGGDGADNLGFGTRSDPDGDQFADERFADIMSFGRLSRALSNAPLSSGVVSRRASRAASKRGAGLGSVDDSQAHESGARCVRWERETPCGFQRTHALALLCARTRDLTPAHLAWAPQETHSN